MAVYVDLPLWYPYQNKKWAHLLADTEDEVHECAAKIGLKKEWFQKKKGKLPHYDVTITKRAKAIAAGAIPVDRFQMALFIRNYKRTGKIQDTYYT